MVRDQALALGGLLSRKMGGPSRLSRRSPTGLWQAAFNGERTWTTSAGEDRYRRGLYTFWRRTVPYPSMATFDAPSREICTVRRVRTNTPLQAFVTLNDPVYVEAAQALARRIVARRRRDDRGPGPLRAAALPGPAAAATQQVEQSVELYRERSATTTAQDDEGRPGNWRPTRSGRCPTGMDRRRAGRLDGRGQRAAEPRWRADEGLIAIRTVLMTRDLDQTRRPHDPPALPQGLRRPASGAIALGGAHSADARPRSRAVRPRNPLAPRPPHFAAEGQERHLPAHVRRRRRSRTCSTTSRSSSSITCSPARTSCCKDQRFAVHQGASQAARHAVQVRAARPERRVGQRAAAATSAELADDVAFVKSM